MADRKNQGEGYSPGKKSQNINNSKVNPSSVFNRSFTVNSSSAAAANNPLYNLYTRNGSVKGLHGSSFVSMVSAGNSFSGKVRRLRSLFDSSKHAHAHAHAHAPTNHNSKSSSPLPSPTASPTTKTPHGPSSDPSIFIPRNAAPSPDPVTRTSSSSRLPGTEDRIVIYFTSLRGIRRTFQDCHSIRLIFRGFRMNIDERDISMDVAYREELQKVLGENNVSLPQVFIKGKHVGGAEVIKHMLEAGELAKMIKGLPLRAMNPCDACDDVRFIPCTNCSGSRKVFDEDEEQTTRCPDCNENGLLRCPLCVAFD